MKETIAYMDINEQISYLKRIKKEIAQDIEPEISELESIRTKGRNIFLENEKILSLMYTLLKKDISHIFIAKQIFAFHKSIKITKLGPITLRLTNINVFTTSSGIDVANFIRRKTNFIITNCTIQNDPRINPIAIAKSCLEIEKYLCGAKIIF